MSGRGRGVPKGKTAQQKRKTRLTSVKSEDHWKQALSHSHERHLVVYFYSGNTTSGKSMLNFIREVSAEHSLQRLSFVEVDVDLNEETEGIAKEQKVYILPTVEVWSDSVQIERLEGGDPMKVIELLEKHAKSTSPNNSAASAKGALKLGGSVLLFLGVVSSIGAVLYSRRHGRKALNDRIANAPLLKQARYISAM